MDQQSGKKKQDIFTITPEDLIELSREETVPKPWYKNIFPRQDDTEAKKFKFLKKSDEQHHKLMMLWIKATKPLTNINQLIQPDRVCVLFLKNIYTGMYFEVGRTEIKWGNFSTLTSFRLCVTLLVSTNCNKQTTLHGWL
jgi:hypothetical protein